MDKNILQKMLSFIPVEEGQAILEIGAGQGVLTRLLAKKKVELFAVEIDKQLALLLEEEFKDNTNVKVIQADILGFDIKNFSQKLKRPLIVVGNIPYYITSPIIEKLFLARDCIKDIFLTVQKEFAQRMQAIPGSRLYGAFSCFVQYYSNPKILFTIKRSCFFPVPKVDSCFVHLKPVQKKWQTAINEDNLFFIIRQAFQQRRKMLKNSLKKVVPEETLDEFFKQEKLSSSIRAEQVSLEQFICLLGMLNQEKINIVNHHK
ncbi:MAG: 16S rRNA (adenine(1518)-N(6)/adenine(1519)-N(6))-dimethyltransferase RsmA [Candidatus Omnitrophica bacterium]|nr:16S rRNA (adenine(1518)-N(6)/adenine(1519)-N(6))-dimethyltransferase RsmA [Candidatus Omnitrophota bacterium]